MSGAASQCDTVDYKPALIKKHGEKFDPGGKVAGKWLALQTPRAFLLDANGALVYRGAIDNYKYSDDPDRMDYLEPAIEQFMSGVPLTRPETASFGCAIQSVYYILPKAL